MSLLNTIGATRLGVWGIGHVVSPLQRRLALATGGRVSLTGKPPVLLLTASGRRSGQPRTIPLIFLRDGDDLAVCNVRPPFERPNPWPLNVRANPKVSVRIRDVTEQRVAREAQPQEVEKYRPLFGQDLARLRAPLSLPTRTRVPSSYSSDRDRPAVLPRESLGSPTRSQADISRSASDEKHRHR